MLKIIRYSLRLKNVHHSHSKTPSSFFSTQPPIHVGLTESAGRGVFASRRIENGELIHTAQPIVSHPSLSCIGTVCYLCLKRLETNSVDPNILSYCSNQCQEKAKSFTKVEEKADWSSFNEHCRMQGLKYPLLLKRLACQIISGTVSADVLDILQPEISSCDKTSLAVSAILHKKSFKHIPPGVKDHMKKEAALLRRTFEYTDIEREKMEFLTEEWYAAVLARIRINAFRIELAGGSYEDMLASAAASVDAEAAVGNAVYLLPSLYNHDCDPNVNIVWIDNVDAKIKALREIEKGEELRICYIDASMDYEARQSILYQGFGFKCNCVRCISKD